MADSHNPATPTKPVLQDFSQRLLFYNWVLSHTEEIKDDPTAHGVLGKAPVIASSDGTLKTPRELLLDSTLPDVGLGWGPGSEVPVELSSFLGQTYNLDNRKIKQMVEYLLKGIQRCAAREDKKTLEEFLFLLVRVLSEESEEFTGDFLKRYKINRSLIALR